MLSLISSSFSCFEFFFLRIFVLTLPWLQNFACMNLSFLYFAWTQCHISVNQNKEKSCLLDEFSWTPPEKKIFLTFLMSSQLSDHLVIHLELLENTERFAAFFGDKIISFVHHLGWKKSLQAQFSFCQPLTLCTASDSAKISSVIASAVLIIMVLIYGVNTLAKQAKYRPSDRVRWKNANYAKFAVQITQLERPIMR